MSNRGTRFPEVDDCSSAGSESCWGDLERHRRSEWGVLPPPPDSNMFAPLADAEIVPVGPTVPDSVVDALQYDLTHGDSDTDNHSSGRCRARGSGRGR